MRISRPRVVVTGDESILSATMASRSLETMELVEYGEIAMATLDHGASSPSPWTAPRRGMASSRG